VTSPTFAYADPTFDLSGDYLYFSTNQGLEPVYSDVDDYDTYFFANSSRLGYLPLRKDVKSPFLPRNDEEEVKPEPPGDKDADKAADKAGSQADGSQAKPGKDAKPAAQPDSKQPKPVKIDFEGIASRGRALPVEGGNFSGLGAGNRKLYYARAPRTGGDGKAKVELFQFDLDRAAAQDPAKPAEQLVASDVQLFQLTSDASKLLLMAGGGALFVVSPEPGVKLEKPVPGQALPKQIDPRHEWRQMIWEDYRLFKEKFYDPNMHGVDWEAARDRALAKLPYAGCTEDVGFILSEMNGEVNVGHSFVNPALSSWPPDPHLGSLGCDFERAMDSQGHDGIRISHIYRGAASELDASGPLAAPGVDVQAGQFLLAVNGTPLDPARSPYERLIGQAGATVQLTVGDNAVRDGSTRDVLVKAIGSDAELRHRDWVEANRRYAFEKSGGRVGYIHMRDCVSGGAVDLERQLLGQHDMDALIIDGRYNSGGYAPRQFVEILGRQVRDFITPRYGRSARVPNFVAPGAKVMLINQYAGSSGDEFPFFFRQSGLGKIVGVRTWGGLVGLSGGDQLLDGTGVVVPSLAFYTADNKWLIEGYGTDPDITVVNDPTSAADGKDNQLDRAITEALAEADAHPYQTPPHPPFVDRSGVRTTEREP
jgi:tricorn protease